MDRMHCINKTWIQSETSQEEVEGIETSIMIGSQHRPAMTSHSHCQHHNRHATRSLIGVELGPNLQSVQQPGH